MNRSYGYCRVSSKEQNVDRQIMALQQAGICRELIAIERQSGKDFDRPIYRGLCRRLKPGDTLVIKSIDRLGRNYAEILEQWRILTKEKKIHIRVLDMPLLNTGNARDLTGELIADIVLQLLSYVAQTERELIRQRQAEGIAAARKKGIHLGRKAMEIPENFPTVCQLWRGGQISSRKAGSLLGVSHATFLRWAKCHG